MASGRSVRATRATTTAPAAAARIGIGQTGRKVERVERYGSGTEGDPPAGERYLLLADISGYTGFMAGVVPRQETWTASGSDRCDREAVSAGSSGGSAR
jgi:hypothetical protein